MSKMKRNLSEVESVTRSLKKASLEPVKLSKVPKDVNVTSTTLDNSGQKGDELVEINAVNMTEEDELRKIIEV